MLRLLRDEAAASVHESQKLGDLHVPNQFG